MLNKITIILAFAGLTLTGCMGSSGSGSPAAAAPGTDTPSLAVSGTLNASNPHVLAHAALQKRALDLTAYTVVCTTATTPPVTASAPVKANGSFSLQIAGGMNQPMTCYVTDANGTKVADFLISDNVHKDLNGNNSVSNTATFASNVGFGAVSFNPDSGEVTVPVGQVQASMVAGNAHAQVFDPTGTWTIHPVDFTLPSGVRGPCTQQENQSNDCNGPPDGQALYFKMWDGVKTADNSTVHALQLWAPDSGDPAAAFATCGSKVGLTAQQKNDLGLDFSAYGAADAPFTFATSLADFDDQVSGNHHEVVNNLADGWKLTDVATTQWSYQTGCGPKNVQIGGQSYNGWSCGPDQNNLYQLGLNGGCVDADNKPVNVSNWSNVTRNADGSGGQAQSSQSTTDANLIQSSTMQGYYNGKAVTCTSQWTITDANGVPQGTQQNPAQFDWNHWQQNQTTYNAGTFCSNLANQNSPDQQKLLQLQCYSNYYYQSGLERDSNVCIPKVQMDWTQTDPAKFVHVDFRPNSMVFMDQYNPFPDGKGGSMLTRQEEYRGVQVNGSWVNCHVIDTGGITMKRVSDTKLFATYQSTTVTTDKDIPACAANFTGTKKTFFFYLTK